MKKYICILIVLTISSYDLNAQSEIESSGVTLQKLALSIQESKNIDERKTNNNIITQNLIETLKNPVSFNYNFDSLLSIKRIASQDGLFNIFTWQVQLEEGVYLQNGIMQLKVSDDSVKLFVFNDQSDKMGTPENENCTLKNWFGAIYYDLHETEFNGIKYYTLLGYDEYSNSMTQKVIEVLHFENNEPIFGGDYFIYPPDDTYPTAPIKRFIYTYKKGSNALIKFEKKANAIILSELSSIEKNLNNKSTLVPTGDEVYFVWRYGKWFMPRR